MAKDRLSNPEPFKAQVVSAESAVTASADAEADRTVEPVEAPMTISMFQLKGWLDPQSC